MINKNKAYSDLFDELKKFGVSLTSEQAEALRAKVGATLNYEPKVGVFGKTGAGKSSLCNALFGSEAFPISDVQACTREPQEEFVKIGSKGIKLLDVPGVGESHEREKEYSELYRSLLPELDLVLWVLKGDDRAFSVDELYYKEVVLKQAIDAQKVPFIFVLNQVDKIEPFREWDVARHQPSEKQKQNIDAKVGYVSKVFDISGRRVVPVSANEKYGLDALVDNIVNVLPADKKYAFATAAKEEYVSKTAKGEAKSGLSETIWKYVKEIGGAAINAIVESSPISAITKGIGKVLDWLF